MTLVSFWFGVLVVFWTGFLVLEGFDFGVGMLHGVVGRDEIQKVLEQGDDVLDVEGLATHRLPLEEAPAAYEMFQKKQDGCVKVVLKP